MATLRVGMVGYKFMGKAHSNAWMKVNKFFDLDAQVERQAICGRTESAVKEMASTWDWKSVETDWRELIKRDDIDIIDIGTPNNTHAEIAIAACEAGKHVICEKPLAMNVAEARQMAEAAKKAQVTNMVWFNYRRVPAASLAHKLIADGRLGTIYHVRAAYRQDWIMDPDFPLVWRLQSDVAGSGAHGDLNAHLLDMARFLTGDEITEVMGHTETFIKERPIGEMTGGLKAGTDAGQKKGKVTVDDAVAVIARFGGGALGTFEATRYAAGRKNFNEIEINGSKGSLVWNFQSMNELHYYSAEDDAETQGFRKIIATEPDAHPYVGAWWPPGHIIGYEHTFINQAADFVDAITNKKPVTPDFDDGARTQAVLDAVLKSAEARQWTKVE